MIGVYLKLAAQRISASNGTKMGSVLVEGLDLVDDVTLLRVGEFRKNG